MSLRGAVPKLVKRAAEIDKNMHGIPLSGAIESSMSKSWRGMELTTGDREERAPSRDDYSQPFFGRAAHLLHEELGLESKSVEVERLQRVFFHSENSHTISCGKCICQMTECPQCRLTLPAKRLKVPCDLVAQIAEQVQYECPHGCKKHIQGFSALTDHKSLFRPRLGLASLPQRVRDHLRRRRLLGHLRRV